jgi:uncharacterized protein (TIGR02596 family)
MEPVIVRPRAFSIVELLVVIAIISILMALTVPAVSSLIENTNVTRGAQLVESQIQLARQLASSRNRPVEVRLIKVPAQSADGVSAIQLWQMDPPSGANAAQARPLTRAEMLPTAICISEDATAASRLFAKCGFTNSIPSGSPLSGSSYAAFQIFPSGLLSPYVDMQTAYVTVLPTRNAKETSLPRNYAIIQINPMTGTPSTYRP